jgi:hypothetical protein
VSLTMRCRIEVGLAVLAGVFCVVTLISHDWIETVFGVDPDHGSGWLEWLIVVILALASAGAGLRARADLRRLRTATAGL